MRIDFIVNMKNALYPLAKIIKKIIYIFIFWYFTGIPGLGGQSYISFKWKQTENL